MAKLTAPAPTAEVNDNLKYGEPTKDYTDLVEREWYAIGYDKRYNEPRWVSYRLTSLEVLWEIGLSRSEFTFIEDPRVRGGTACTHDYTHSGYDRGHIAPAGDMMFSRKALHDSFYMSNICPQVPNFNRGVWKDLESWIRRLAKREGSIIVVAGPVLPTNLCEAVKGKWIGRYHKVFVPTAFYKVVLDDTPPRKAIGFVLPNESTDKSFTCFSCSVDEVENLTNMNFFSTLEDAEQAVIESEHNPSKWDFR